MAKGKEMEAILKIVGNLDPSVQNAVNGATKAISGIGKGMAVAGGVVAAGMAAATAAAVAFGTEAVKAAASYEQAFANASTLMQGTPEELQKISDEIIAVSNETGLAAEDVSNAVYSALSAGIDQADAVAFVGDSAKLAAAGFTDVDTAMSAVAKTMNAYGMDASHTDEIQKVLIQTQNKGITTVGELGASLAQVTPTAAAFGVSFDQVGASLATMTAQGTPTAQATTQLNSLIAELGKNGTIAANNLEKAAEGTEWAGMSFAEMQANGATLNDVLGMMSTAANESGLSMVDMFSSIEAGKAALSIYNGEGETFLENLEAMNTNEDVVGQAYEQVTDTLEHQIEVLKNLGKNFMISVGQKILPYVKTIAESALPLIEQGMDALLPVFDSIMAAVGPALENVANTLLPMLSGAIEQVGPVLESLTPLLMEGVSSGMDMFAQFLPTVQSGLALVMELVQQLAPVLMNVGATVMPVIASLIQVIFGVLQQLAPIVAQIVEAVLPVLAQLIAAIAPVIEQILTALSPVIEAIGNLVSAILPPLMSIIQALIPIFTTVISIIGTQLANAFQILTPIIEAVTKIVTAMGDTVAEVFKGLVGAVTTPVNAIINTVNGIIDAINSLKIEIPEWVPVFGGSVFSLNLAHIPTFAKGGFTDGISIAGEAGTEAIISFDSAYRSANLDYWMKAGQMLGALDNNGAVNSDSALAGKLLSFNDFSLSELASGGNTYVYDFSGMQYNPTINVEGNADKEDWMSGLEESKYEFSDWLEEWLRRKKEAAYA
ncbi:MAG: phage tail tape measure protein [Lachnospiraceae bacterium]|nr:phage tail tape measure protein [Lachnospiraceae bacterium]